MDCQGFWAIWRWRRWRNPTLRVKAGPVPQRAGKGCHRNRVCRPRKMWSSLGFSKALCHLKDYPLATVKVRDHFPAETGLIVNGQGLRMARPKPPSPAVPSSHHGQLRILANHIRKSCVKQSPEFAWFCKALQLVPNPICATRFTRSVKFLCAWKLRQSGHCWTPAFSRQSRKLLLVEAFRTIPKSEVDLQDLEFDKNECHVWPCFLSTIQPCDVIWTGNIRVNSHHYPRSLRIRTHLKVSKWGPLAPKKGFFFFIGWSDRTPRVFILLMVQNSQTITTLDA